MPQNYDLFTGSQQAFCSRSQLKSPMQIPEFEETIAAESFVSLPVVVVVVVVFLDSLS